jgi:hypothetical protein
VFTSETLAPAGGGNISPDLGSNLIGKGLTVEAVILLVNRINTTEKHSYDKYIRMKTSIDEDRDAFVAAKSAASVDKYGICLWGNSCIDPPKAALNSILNNRARMANRTTLFTNGMGTFNKNLAGMNKLIPNSFIDNLNSGINMINSNLFNSWFSKTKSSIEVGKLQFIGYDKD